MNAKEKLRNENEAILNGYDVLRRANLKLNGLDEDSIKQKEELDRIMDEIKKLANKT